MRTISEDRERLVLCERPGFGLFVLLGLSAAIMGGSRLVAAREGAEAAAPMLWTGLGLLALTILFMRAARVTFDRAAGELELRYVSLLPFLSRTERVALDDGTAFRVTSSVSTSGGGSSKRWYVTALPADGRKLPEKAVGGGKRAAEAVLAQIEGWMAGHSPG